MNEMPVIEPLYIIIDVYYADEIKVAHMVVPVLPIVEGTAPVLVS